MTGNERKENIEQEKQIESKHYDGRYKPKHINNYIKCK